MTSFSVGKGKNCVKKTASLKLRELQWFSEILMYFFLIVLGNPYHMAAQDIHRAEPPRCPLP